MKFHLVVPSPSFDEGLAFFLDELGFTLERITPSENPSLAILTGFGISICLDKNVVIHSCQSIKTTSQMHYMHFNGFPIRINA